MLSPGDQLLLYTDGVTEAFNVKDEQYGGQRLEEFLMKHTDLHPHEITDALKGDIQAWADGAEQSDDITILALEIGVPPELTATLVVPAKVEELDRVNEFITRVVQSFDKSFGGFIKGKALDSLIVTLLLYALLSIFRVPYALLLSAFIAIFNIIKELYNSNSSLEELLNTATNKTNYSKPPLIIFTLE
jgi:hypothetical protein